MILPRWVHRVPEPRSGPLCSRIGPLLRESRLRKKQCECGSQSYEAHWLHLSVRTVNGRASILPEESDVVARLWLPAAFAIVSPIVCALPGGFDWTLTLESAVFLRLRCHAREAGGAAFAARGARELRPRRPLTQRTRAVGVGVAVDRREPRRRLTLLDPRCSAVRLSILALNGPKPWPKPGIM